MSNLCRKPKHYHRNLPYPLKGVYGNITVSVLCQITVNYGKLR